MKNITKTLFGQLYYFKKNSHFQLKTNRLYCETFYIPEHFIYGIFDFKLISNSDFFSNIVIGNRDNSFKIQEKYKFIDNIEILKLEQFKNNEYKEIELNNIDSILLKNLKHKDDTNIITCSCCHRF